MRVGTTFVFLVGYWVLFIVTLRGNEEQAIMYYPAPIAILLLLLLVRNKLPHTSEIERKVKIEVQRQ